jgi:aminoglycoside 3-N-acetyltransferase
VSEKESTEKVKMPNTRLSLAQELRQSGVTPGLTLIVHSSLSSLGWVAGGPVAVIQALMDTVTPAGTLVMPAHSGDYSDPGQWQFPSVPAPWHAIIRETMPAFDPAIVPTRAMGRIAETFRAWPDVRRSYHPTVSFAAWGRHAERITNDHELANGLGERSPLARIYELGGFVLLLGVDYGRNTSFHLAEYRVPGSGQVPQGSPIFSNGRRVWQTYYDINLDTELFPEIGADLEKAGHVRLGQIGAAPARLFEQRTAVDFAEEWLGRRRQEQRRS